MNETSIPVHKLLAIVLWGFSGGLLIGAWVVYFANLSDLAGLLASTGVMASLGAATATARAWAMCIVRTARLRNFEEECSSLGLHTVHD